jgi:hypothetical protein
MHYMTKLGIYLSSLGGLTFMTGMISSSVSGSSRGSYASYVPACVMGGIIIFFIGFAMFGYGIYKEEIIKAKKS